MRESLEAAEAQQIILDAAGRLGSEVRPAAGAQDCILSEPIVSSRTLPPWDVSAMDGYALRSADLNQGAATLRVVREIAAGAGPGEILGAGSAARIFTGAPIPPGADCVVRQEEAERSGDRVTIRSAVPGDHVRPKGEDIAVGDRVLEAGVRLGPAELGVLASLGRSTVAVHQTPRVALLSGGDELIEPDGDSSPGRIVSSNS